MVVWPVEVAGQEEVQPDTHAVIVIGVQHDLVEDVVVLAQGKQFRSIGQLLQSHAHDPGFGREFIQGFTAIEFDVVDVVPVDPAQIFGDPVHVVH